MKLKIRLAASLSFLFIFSLMVLNSCAQPNGEALFQLNCSSCHGTDLTGGNGGSLIDGVWKFGDKDSYIVRNIKFGIPHLGMPSYEKTLKDEEINAIVRYIRDSEKNPAAVKGKVIKELETIDYNLNVEIFAEGLETPWAIDFTDVNTALITELPGRLRVVKNGRLLPEAVKNTPQVLHEGQGGLMDVAIDPDYKQNAWIYLAYSHVLENSD